MFDRTAIYTYEDGRPIEGRPDPLPAMYTFMQKVAHVLEWQRYEDKVHDVWNKGFSGAFKDSIN